MNTPNSLDALTQDQVLLKWQEAKNALAKAKDFELDLRKYVVSRAFPDRTEGMNTAELGNGYLLKAAIKFNYTLDSDNAKVEAALDAVAKVGNQGSFIADRLVNWKPTFLLTEYRELCKDDATADQKQIRKIIESVLTITDAAPTLEIKSPKEKK